MTAIDQTRSRCYILANRGPSTHGSRPSPGRHLSCYAFRLSWLQRLDAGAGAVLVFLRGAAADAAGAFDDAIADDRDRALAHDHLAARGRGDAARRRRIGTRLHLAAGPAERGRGDRLPLAAIGAAPDRIIHALERDQPAAGVAHRGADLDVELLRLGDCAA